MISQKKDAAASGAVLKLSPVALDGRAILLHLMRCADVEAEKYAGAIRQLVNEGRQSKAWLLLGSS